MLEMLFFFFPQLFNIFHNLPFQQEAPKAQFGSGSLCLCHTLICLVSEQICLGVIRC